MAPPPVSDARLKQALRLFHKYDGNISLATQAAGLSSGSWMSFKRTLIAARKKFPDLAKQYAVKPKTISDHAVEYVERNNAKLAAAKLNDALREIALLTEEINRLKWSSQASLKPSEWSLSSHVKKKREHLPYLLTSDFQIGEVVRPEETEHGYGYDVSVFRKRYRKLIDTTIYLSFNHAGENWTYPGIIYARGGDTISGGLHDELRETDELTPIEACKVAFEEESAGIAKLADAFGRVDVKTPGAAGNHDRDTLKPRSKQAAAHSYDSLVSFMLQQHFKSDKRVHFQTSESFDVYFPIYDLNILLTHGDRMGSSGGQGFIGPLATILRGADKVIREQAAIGRPVSRVDHGHFHTPNYAVWVLSNGCMPGYTEYAKAFRMRPSPPSQMLAYHHPKGGLVDLKPINLLET